MTIKQHTFESTGDAYDACQYEEDISKGDILLIPSEGVIGIADTWPFAVTAKHGALHRVIECAENDSYIVQFAASIALAKTINLGD